MKGSHQLRSIFSRELSAYFNSAIAYIFIIVFVLLSGGLYMTNFFLLGAADMRAFFDMLPLVLCVFIPALTMRLWAEDKKGNTFELLLTFPVPTYKLVLAKFLAAFVFYLMALACTAVIPVMLNIIGAPDHGPIIGGYLGAILLGAFFIGVGIFVSGLCIDQIAAFILSVMGSFFFFLIGWEVVSASLDGWVPGMGTFLTGALSAGGHFTAFTKGVVDLRDVLYFVLFSVMFLVLNALAVEDRLRRSAKAYFTATAVFGFFIIVCANTLLSDLSLGRFDITSGRVYTVTQAAQRILEKLDAPVTIKLYISSQDKMPTALKTLEQDTKDRLEELRVKSKGKLQFKTVRMEAEAAVGDPNEDTAAAKLYKKGVAPISVRSIDKDEVGVKLIYSSIGVAYKDRDEEYIPRVLTPDIQNLEYMISAKIYRMMLEKKPVVAIVAPYEEKEIDPGLLNLLKRMGQAAPLSMREDNFRGIESSLQYEDYAVKRIRLNEKEPIPDGVDALVVMAPQTLTPRQRFEINRFLYQGGKVVMAAQNYIYDYKQNQFGTAIFPKQVQHQVNDLIGAYGVRIDDRILMDENHELINVSGSVDASPMAFSAPVKVPIQVRVQPEQMNRDISITSALPSIFYLWGSPLVLEEDKLKNLNLKKTTLFSSSQLSWLVAFRGNMLNKEDISSVGRTFTGPFPLAVMLEGQFPDIFESKDVPPWEEPEPAAGQKPSVPVLEPEKNLLKPENARPGKLVVVGCVKMFEDNFMPNSGSPAFFTNAVDVLTLGGELINIRNHRAAEKKVKALSSTEKLLWRFMVVFLVPLLIILIGVVRLFWRRKEKAMYLQAVRRG